MCTTQEGGCGFTLGVGDFEIGDLTDFLEEPEKGTKSQLYLIDVT